MRGYRQIPKRFSRPALETNLWCIVITVTKGYTVYQELTVKLISDLLRFIKPPVKPGGFF
jgi:hypothetical protein